MKFTNIFDKLKIVYDLIMNSNIFIVLVMLIIGVFLLRLTNKINNKKMGIIIYLVELAIFGVVFYTEKDSAIAITDNLIDNIFLNFYFPSIYVYLFILVVSITMFVYTLLNRFISNTYRIITNTYFLLFNFIFILLVKVIIENDIDIFAKESLFTNNNTLVLLELSTLLFFIYIIINILIYITNYLILLVENKKVSTVQVKNTVENNVNIEINVENDFVEKEKATVSEPLISFEELINNIDNSIVETKIDLIPEANQIYELNTETETKINLVPELVIKEDYKFINPLLFNDVEVDNNIITTTEELPLNKVVIEGYKEEIKNTEEKITLNDYKLFSKMLKTIIERNNNTNISLSDLLNINLLDSYSAEDCNKFEKILNSCLN